MQSKILPTEGSMGLIQIKKELANCLGLGCYSKICITLKNRTDKNGVSGVELEESSEDKM